MSLIYFHRFLIACGILFCLTMGYRLFTGWQLNARTDYLIGSIVSGVAAVALGFYLRTVRLPRRQAS